MDQGNRIRAGTPGTTGVISSEPCDKILSGPLCLHVHAYCHTRGILRARAHDISGLNSGWRHNRRLVGFFPTGRNDIRVEMTAQQRVQLTILNLYAGGREVCHYCEQENRAHTESATTKTWHKGPGPLLNTRTFHYEIVSRWFFHSFSPAFSLFNITREAHDQQKLQIFINTVFRYHSIIWRRRTVLKYTQNAVEIAHGTDRICRKDYR